MWLLAWAALASAQAPDPLEAEALAPPEAPAGPASEAEPPAPAPVEIPKLPSLPAPWAAEPGSELRAPLLALQEVRFERSRRSLGVFGAVAGVEAGLGLLSVAGGAQTGNSAGTALLVSGAIHGISAWYQLDVNHRRAAAFAARLSETEGGPPEAWQALLRRQRLEAERTARSHAFSTGLYAGLLGFAVSGAITSAALSGDTTGLETALGASLGLLGFGVTGVVLHGSRWRAASRLSGDLAALDWRPPLPLGAE